MTTLPGGSGSFVTLLAEPGSTIGLESEMLGFLISANDLYVMKTKLASRRASMLYELGGFSYS